MSSSTYWDNNYSATGVIEQSPFTRALHEKILELIPPEPQKILDVGCGSGVLMHKLNSLGKHQVTGTDLSEEAVRIVREELKYDCFAGSITDLRKVDDKSYDTVICSEVIEHIFKDDLDKAFSELVRIAKDRIIITTPYREDLEYHQSRCEKCRTLFHPAGHIREVNETFLTSYMRKYASDYAFYYTGERAPRFKTYAGLTRSLGGNVVWLDNLHCPVCRNKIEKDKPSPIRKLLDYGYYYFQKLLFVIGCRKYNNIIMAVNLQNEQKEQSAGS